MSMRCLSGVGAAIVVGLGLASSASAGTYAWNWQVGDIGTSGMSTNGGAIESIYASFNTTTKQLTWNATFSNQIARGYTLAVSKGPNPKGHAGELALLYFDAESLSSPKLTVYAYNGQNLQNSWRDGNGNVGGNQTPDLIKGKNDTSYILNIEAKNVGTKRQFNLTIDTSAINSHTPLYPSGDDDWTGAQWAQKLGLWFHPVKGLDAGYNSNGSLKKWDITGQGWLDLADCDTDNMQVVPLPTAGAMASAALLGVAGIRRRRQSL